MISIVAANAIHPVQNPLGRVPDMPLTDATVGPPSPTTSSGVHWQQ
jgi:hypothetical protein